MRQSVTDGARAPTTNFRFLSKTKEDMTFRLKSQFHSLVRNLSVWNGSRFTHDTFGSEPAGCYEAHLSRNSEAATESPTDS